MLRGMELLGLKVRDVTTGFEGVVESVCFDLYGCVQAVVRPTVHFSEKGEQVMPDGRYLDVHRLRPVTDAPVMALPTFEEVHGPADKPVR